MTHLIFKSINLNNPNYKNIYFSMGCFWGSEQLFWGIIGVVYTEVGYANGNTDNPSCEDIFKSNITHREVVRVVYDIQKTNLENIVKVFFENHKVDFMADEPVPEPYKSAVFYENDIDYQKIIKYRDNYTISRKNNGIDKSITTEINPLIRYIIAHEDHQQYTLKHKDVFCYLGFNGIIYNPDKDDKNL